MHTVFKGKKNTLYIYF